MKLGIIEDQTMIRELLVLACRRAFPQARVYSAANAEEGLALCRREQPELVLLDLVLPDRDGLALVPDIRTEIPAVKIIALSSHMDEFTLHRADAAKVNGFVDKNGQTLEILQEAIVSVLAGQVYYCSVVRKLRAQMKVDPSGFSKVLTGREMELLGLFGHGCSNEAIAKRMGLSPSTVRNHRQNIMTKLNLGSTPQLIHYALAKGFTRVGQ